MIKRFPSYRATNSRVLFNFLALPDVDRDDVEDILLALGFSWSQRNPDDILGIFSKSRLGGKSIYFRTAKPAEAPDLVNCSTFTQWCYARIGIELPLRAIQQYQMGEPLPDMNTIKVGDLLFKSGEKNYWDYQEPKIKIGHVALVRDVASRDGAVIHASNNAGGVVEIPVNEFLKKNSPCIAACRIVTDLKHWTTLNIPPELSWRIQSSDDVKWLILEHIKPGG